MRVRSPSKQAAIEIGKPSIDGKARRARALVMAAPLLHAARCIDRVRPLECREVHRALDDEGSGLKGNHLGKRVRAVQFELCNVRAGNLGKRGVSIPCQRAVIADPIRRLRSWRATSDLPPSGERSDCGKETDVVSRHAGSPLPWNHSSRRVQSSSRPRRARPRRRRSNRVRALSGRSRCRQHTL